MTRFARHIGLILATLFLLLQGVASAHAGLNPVDHDHDGVACSVTVMAEEQAVAPEPVIIDTPILSEQPVVAHALPTAERVASRFEPRAPPPRGPPA